MRSEAEVAAMACPVCRVPLTMSERQGIEIDYCPQCRGVWLDRGELDKIIERSAEPAPARAQPQAPLPPQQQAGPWDARQGHAPHYGYGKPYKKQKHWLHDLFD